MMHLVIFTLQMSHLTLLCCMAETTRNQTIDTSWNNNNKRTNSAYIYKLYISMKQTYPGRIFHYHNKVEQGTSIMESYLSVIIVLKIIIQGCKSPVLWSDILFNKQNIWP